MSLKEVEKGDAFEARVFVMRGYGDMLMTNMLCMWGNIKILVQTIEP